MNLLSLFGKFFKKNHQDQSNYLCLVITPDRITALIWTLEEEQVKVLGYDHKNLASIDHLLHQAAVAIDKAGEEAKVDVAKTVFGLASDWLEEGNLSAKSAKLLKKLAEELDLEPQAYVPLATSIDHLLKAEQTPAPNFIAIGIFGQEQGQVCEIHQIVANKVIVTKTTQSPINIEKIQALIKELTAAEKLPPRIVVYGQDPSSLLADKIRQADWQDIFMNEPRIDFLDDQALTRAVAYAQAADLLGREPISQQAKTVPAADELGFVQDQDILLSAQTVKDQKLQKEEYAVEVESSNIAQETPAPKSQSLKNLFNEKLRFFVKISSILQRPNLAKKAGIGLTAILIFSLVAAYVAGQTLTRAQVIIKVNAQSSDAQFTANVVAGAPYDASLSQIAGQAITVSAQGNQKAVTTGSKKIGENANGEVTVYYNPKLPTKTFPKGTKIITENGLKFSLDNDVEAASASASVGQAKVHVTAEVVGPQYNLEPGQQFSFTEFDQSYWAQNDAPFSGGSERQTTIVTQEDMDRLQKALYETLVQKARDEAKNKAQGLTLVDDAIVAKITKTNFDKNAGEEASLLNLDLQVEANSIVFDEGQLQKLIAEKATDLPKDLMVRPQDIQISQSQVARLDSKLQIKGQFKASLVPKFDEGELKAKIAGKSLKETRAIIKEIPQVSDVSVHFSPNLPLVGNLPRNQAKISFKIEAF